MKFKLFTLFPEMFPGGLKYSLAGEALKNGVWGYQTVDLKLFGIGKFPRVDDAPYGGGAGMVMRADVIEKAVESQPFQKLIYMSPRGTLLTQKKVLELTNLNEISILCGRFEGIDERVIEHYKIEEISIGDYIISGGETAALVLMDSIIRCLKGVLGSAKSHDEESFSNGLLEYPHYTRPAEWNGLKVPEVLTSGDHAKVAEWRLQKSREITKKRRPDLFKNFNDED